MSDSRNRREHEDDRKGGGRGRRPVRKPRPQKEGGREKEFPPQGEVEGRVSSVTASHYGFVEAILWPGQDQWKEGQRPPRYFFHSKGLKEVKFEDLKLGDRVKGVAILDRTGDGTIKGVMLTQVERV